jgi:very-short-patch-repair endonuclease
MVICNDCGKEYETLGFKLIRFWENDINNNIESVINILKGLL